MFALLGTVSWINVCFAPGIGVILITIREVQSQSGREPDELVEAGGGAENKTGDH
jgi:hypothetical protein